MAGVESVLIIAMCIYYFFDQLKQPNVLAIYTSINFWIIIAFLIYLSGTFFLNIYSESMLQDKNFQKQYKIINFSFYILKNILFCVALCMRPDIKNPETIMPEDKLSANWGNTNPEIK